MDFTDFIFHFVQLSWIGRYDHSYNSTQLNST